MPARPSPQDPMIQSAILGILGTRGATSRAELARLLDVSSATITQLSKVLIARGLVTELDTTPSNGGRPARLLGLVRSAGSAVGVKVTADHVAVVQVGLAGTIEASRTVPFKSGRPDALDRLAHLLDDAIGDMSGHLLGVGVGIPGSVDSRASGIVDAPTLGWTDARVGASLRARLGLPVLVENDVNALAVADRLYGAGRDHRSYLVVTIGRGIGCGVVIDGVVHRGASGGAGEIGHLVVDPSGPTCECGSRGCLETLIGDEALVRAARASGAIGARAGRRQLVAAAREGKAEAVAVYADAGRALGLALSGVVQVLDPEAVVLLGEGIDAWSFWEPGFELAFRAGLMPSRRGIPFVVEPWSDDQWALGAAALVLSAPFDMVGMGGDQGRLVRARLADDRPDDGSDR
jgi:predicted NBD/HSP70 family sugar kinase